MAFDYTHPVYQKAAEATKLRSERVCQFCGLYEAEEAHHWRGYLGGDYKPEEETTPDELIGLCRKCHDIATAIRKRHKELWNKEKTLKEEIKELEEERELLYRRIKEFHEEKAIAYQ